MNKTKLLRAQKDFLKRYPGGFQHPEMDAVGKKHKMEKMVEMSQECFAKKKFSDVQSVAENMIKIISRSSMVSMFEKPKFRDTINSLEEKITKEFVNGLKGFLHGNQQKGFETMVSLLSPHKLAKWSLVTILPNYYAPDDEVFVKPTTAKGVIDYFELKGLVYHPKPTWDFYQAYRSEILSMRANVDPSIAPNNAAFGGFLMMSING